MIDLRFVSGLAADLVLSRVELVAENALLSTATHRRRAEGCRPPYRPYFTVLTLAALGAGFWLTYRKPKVVEGDACGCEHPTSNRLGRILLWVVTILVIGFWSFPYVAEKVLG